MPAEWNSREYQRLSNPQFEWGRQVLAQLELRGDETVLDAGCGSGRVTAELLQRLPRGRVLALDLSLNMVRDAAHNLQPFNTRVGCAQADLLALPLGERSLDVVFSTAVFHWISDHPRLFAEIFRVLRPGGRLVAQCGGGPNLRRLRQRAMKLLQQPPFTEFFADWREPWEYPDAEVTAERLRQAGFVAIETGLHSAPTTLANAREFCDFQTTVTLQRHLALIPSETLRRQFLSALAEEFARDHPPFTLDYWRLNLRARRPD